MASGSVRSPSFVIRYPERIGKQQVSSQNSLNGPLTLSKIRLYISDLMARKSSKKPASKRRATPARRARKSAGKGRGWALRTLKWTATLGVWAIIAGLFVIGYYAYDLPDLEEAVSETRRPTVTVLDADGRLLHRAGDLRGVPVTAERLPPAMIQAVLAIEDRRFYDHMGVDLIGITRAMARNVMAGRIVQGGSTITQQLAKNLFLTPERTIKRKVQEVLLSLWLEEKFTKDQILTLYLNRVYLGAGTYGVDAAARRYFGHGAESLKPFEAAMLAGLLKAPSRLNPVANPKKAEARARIVLAAMVDAGFLTEVERRRVVSGGVVALNAERRGHARYFVDWVLDQLPDYARADADLVVQTTLSLSLQEATERHLARALKRDGKALNAGQGAVVVMSPDGAVRALVGGRDYRKSQFNRAVQAVRQPGSAFKPFVYLAALEAGQTADSRVQDAPLKLAGWAPSNFDRKYRGEVTLSTALRDSLNTPAVRLAAQVGPKRVADVATRLGIARDLPKDAGIALGTGEVSLLNLTAAYGTFAAGGAAVWPYAITQVRLGSGDVLFNRQGSGFAPSVAARHVGEMNWMLRQVIDQGTGKRARLDRPAAGKTGTSQKFRDAWFVGYTADYVAGVWLGNDNGSPMKRVTGGGLPALIWRDVMTDVHRGLPVRALPGGDGASIAVELPQSDVKQAATWTQVVDFLTRAEPSRDPFDLSDGP